MLHAETLKKLERNGIRPDPVFIESLAGKYSIRELSVFGSSLGSAFGPGSDIDFLIVFDETRPLSLIDIVNLQKELSDHLQRAVDLVEQDSLVNPIRKKRILSTRELLYAA